MNSSEPVADKAFELPLKITGKLIRVGMLDAGGRGIQLEVEGETIEVIGLTEAECRCIEPKVGWLMSLTFSR